MIFDPPSKRKGLDDLMVPHARGLDYDEACQTGRRASYGSSILNTGVECLLLGVFDTGLELVEKARTFLHAAIEYKESSRSGARGGAESNQLIDFALSEWLIDGRHDLECLKKAVRWKELWFADVKYSDKHEVQLTLPHYLNAQEYETLFRRFEAVRLKPPKNLRSIKGEGTMSYALARHRLGLEYSVEEIAAAASTFLKRNMRSNWLDRGQFDSVAHWMQIALWKPGDDPIATCLKCYDYMPDLERPDYP